MADTMQFDLVSPERRLTSVRALEARIPGADGDMTAMPHHAPVITTLRPGILKIVAEKGEDDYAVTGGFAEVTPEGTTVLAEEALHVSEVTQDILDSFVERAHRQLQEAKDIGHHDLVDDAAKMLSDMVAMGGHIGLTAKTPS